MTTYPRDPSSRRRDNRDFAWLAPDGAVWVAASRTVVHRTGSDEAELPPGSKPLVPDPSREEDDA